MAQAMVAQPADWEAQEQIGLWTDAWRRFRRNRLAVASLAVVVLMIVLAAIAPILQRLGVIADPTVQDVVNSYQSPAFGHHLLGTDDLGRDVLSKVLFGAQVSLSIGILVQVMVLFLGGGIGLVAGYFGGWIDNVLMRFTDIMYAFPDLLFVLIIVAALGPTYFNILFAIGFVAWVGLARLVRGQVLSIKEKEYVEAAHAAGTTPFKIIIKHLLPNALGPVIVTLTFGIPAAIFTEAVLDFLGVGLRPPQPSWGVMVFEGYAAVDAYAYLVIIPCVALSMTMLAFNFVGDGLRDALDPRMRR
ncbi:MAG TPA: ABC transporter permease [Candidatus Dormibacteraeota bacterium]|nr:ABC transporter permease [Candidatus Dormibacteraeota bacterium]